MRLIDFLFWHYYSYSEQCMKKTKTTGDSRWMSIVMIVLTTWTTLGIILCEIDRFIYPLKYLPKDITKLDAKLFGLFICVPWFLLLYFRYYKQKSIVKGKYKVFRERWGDPENVSKKNLKILLVYTLITTIGLLIYAVIMGTLNKHGYFEGCRLFP